MAPIHFTPEQVRAFVEHDEVPDEVRCPISCELMQHPVRVAQNPKSVYSRDSLASALTYCLQDPKTRAPLTRAGVEAAPEQRQAVHTLLLQAAGYEEARARASGVPSESAAKHRANARAFRLRQAFRAWREERLAPLPPATAPTVPTARRTPAAVAARRHLASAHGVIVAAHAPAPEPTTLMGRLCQSIENFLARAIAERTLRSSFRMG